MRKFISFMDELPLWAKILLAIPALDCVWGVYRVMRSCIKDNLGGILLAIIMLIVGIPCLWAVDIFYIVWRGTVWWLD